MTPESIIALDGVEQTICEHALDYGIPAELIVFRIVGGWDECAAIETPMPLPGDPKTGSDVEDEIRRQELNFLTELRRLKRAAEREAKLEVRQREREAKLEVRQREREAKLEERRVLRVGRTYTHSGQTLTVKEWAQQLGLSQEAIYLRLRRGYPLDQALSPVKLSNHLTARTYTHNGQTLTLREWSEHLDVSVHTLQHRLKSGHSFEVVFSRSKPLNHNCRMIEFNGETRSAMEWCRLYSIPRSTLHNRLASGLSIEEALTRPPRPKKAAQ